MIVAASLIGLMAAPALAAFSTPVSLSATASQGPAAAIDGDGSAIAAWSHFDGGGWRVQERGIAATGALGPLKTISVASPQPLWVRIAGGPGGDATVVWRELADGTWRIKARRISAAGELGPVRTLSGPDHNTRLAGVASDDRGDVIVVWGQKRDSWRVKARRISPAGALGPVKTLSDPTQEFEHPDVASDADGNAIAVWTQFGPKSWSIMARRISASGRLGRGRTLSAPAALSAPGEPGQAHIASDAHGRALAVWSQFKSKRPNRRVWLRRISANGRLGRLKDISDPQEQAQSPRIASDARGDSTVVWSAAPQDGGYHAEARRISASGELGSIETLASLGDNQSPQVAIDGSGNATAVWEKIDPDQPYVLARQILGTGTLGPTQTLAAATPLGQAQIAVNAEGEAFAVWSQFGNFDGSTASVWGSLGP